MDNCHVEGNDIFGRISSMDANQTEPLIITCSFSGHVHIWNCDTQKLMCSVKLSNGARAYSVKFIARKGWFVVGSDDGFISVYNYKNEMKNIMCIKAHGSPSYACPLAIHPTKSYLLSARYAKIKLWDWDRRWFGWKCMQTFDEDYRFVHAIAFNPEDYNSFASASHDGTIKVWSLDSSKFEYTLSGHSSPVRCLEFFTRDGQQYLITGSEDKTAKIWDMQKECVRTLPHRSEVRSVLPHPKLPVLVTGTLDGDVYFWSSTNFRLKRILKIGRRVKVQGLAFFIVSGRVAVAHTDGLSVIEIHDEEEQGGSSGSDERN